MTKKINAIDLGRTIIEAECSALHQVSSHLGKSFEESIQAILKTDGNVVLSGVGKSYFIAQKISASMASTGTPSIPLHPVDALHGDLGRIRKNDVVIALSTSGASPEIVEFVKAIPHPQITTIAITTDKDSPLAKLSTIVIDLGHMDEACPMGVAPSTTTTAMLALGDALTLSIAQLRGFTLKDFAQYHPGGSLGRRLQNITSAMRPLSSTPIVHPDDKVLDVLNEITVKRAGAAFAVDEDGKLLGIFTDGDLRRLLASAGNGLDTPIRGHMVENPKTALADTNLAEALKVLKNHQIDELPVVDEEGHLLGYLDIQDVA
ncbi:KpsF/GutQ family sugar-phosphate isomerase [Myxococcota bacterium]|nr:KpsF/GutQ family sugar-phosphate isomerase [Myxococcota bacterium]